MTTKILWIALGLVVLVAGLIGLKVWLGSKTTILPTTQITSFNDSVFVASPSASTDDRVKNLEYALGNLISQIKTTANPISKSTSTDLETRLKTLELSVTDLQGRVKILEGKTTTTTTTATTKSDSLIPLGWTGTTTSTDWTNISSQLISIDPGSYPGYLSMKFEVNLKTSSSGGRAYARLFNQDDNSAVTLSETSSDQTTSSWVSSGGFTLPTNRKSYYLQVKSTANNVASVQNAQIRVSY